MKENIFMTLKGYDLSDKKTITHAMEDYLEMIYRVCKEDDYIRIKELAEKLNVKPSSASKMMQSLKEMNLISYEKYGIIKLTEEGEKLGKYLLYRHNTLEELFKIINKSNDVLKEIERIEHFIDKKTIKNISALICFLKSYEYNNLNN